MILSMFIKSLKEELNNKTNIFIITHSKPDGDGIGSSIALSHALKNNFNDKNICFLLDKELPEQFKFLSKIYKPTLLNNINNIYKEALILFIDTSELSRVEPKILDFINTIDKKSIFLIDHHIPNITNNTYKYLINERSSSTGEMIYTLIKNEFKIELNKDIAEAIYTSIICDTRSFKYARTTTTAHDIAKELMSYGINHENIQTNVFSSNSLDQIKILGYILNNTKLSRNGKIAYSCLPINIIREYNVKPEDTKSFINHLLTIKDVEISVLFREDEESKTKISIRSKGKLILDNFGKEYGGGGTKYASTFTINKKPTHIYEEIINKLENIEGTDEQIRI